MLRNNLMRLKGAAPEARKAAHAAATLPAGLHRTKRTLLEYMRLVRFRAGAELSKSL